MAPIATTLVYDATTGNEPKLPHGQVAGYDTGPGVAWTDSQWAAHPGALHIDQDPGDSDYTADYLDVEARAGTLDRCARWSQRARADFSAGKRSGQREPAVYTFKYNITNVVNALVSGGVKSGVGLVVADWNLTQAEATALVEAASGPFPVIGVQFADAGLFDINVFATPYLQTVSTRPAPAGGGYGPPLNLRADGGLTSVRLTWDPPGTPGLPLPAQYLAYIYEGTEPSRENLVHSYPRKDIAGSPWQGGGLSRGKEYTAHLVAAGPDAPKGDHPGAGAPTLVEPFTYASAQFRTG
jgi:hypothetical protein